MCVPLCVAVKLTAVASRWGLLLLQKQFNSHADIQSRLSRKLMQRDGISDPMVWCSPQLCSLHGFLSCVMPDAALSVHGHSWKDFAVT